MNFLGNIEAKVDNKGRFFIPAQFRKILQEYGEERIVLKKDLYQPCLILYPESTWTEELCELKAKLNKWDRNHQLLLRQYVSDVEVLTLDLNGRVLIPRRYLDMTQIQSEIRLIGLGDKIEIWSTALTEKPFMNPDDFFNVLNDIMIKD